MDNNKRPEPEGGKSMKDDPTKRPTTGEGLDALAAMATQLRHTSHVGGVTTMVDTPDDEGPQGMEMAVDSDDSDMDYGGGGATRGHSSQEDENKKYLKAPPAPKHVRVGDEYQASLPTYGAVQQPHDEIDHHQQRRSQQFAAKEEGKGGGLMSSSLPGPSLEGFEEDGLGTGSLAYR